MGDYNTLIVSARVKHKDIPSEEFRSEVRSRIALCDSAYHATCPVIAMDDGYSDSTTMLSLVTQAKYNHGVEEFLDWLRPMVVGGLGPDDAWAINFSEYTREPRIEYLRKEENES